MTLESAAGKNPVNHVGKLYQFAAQRICDNLREEIAAVRGAECVLVSRIGHPIDDPQVVDVRLDLMPGATPQRYAADVEAIVQRELTALRFAWRELVAPIAALAPLAATLA
jgi:S-adenosylmethionine synthetase